MNRQEGEKAGNQPLHEMYKYRHLRLNNQLESGVITNTSKEGILVLVGNQTQGKKFKF